MNPYDFLELVYFSNGIIGNSSCAIRECSYLGVPAVNIGTRQDSRERGPNVIDVDYNHKEIYKAFNKITSKKINKCLIYGDGNAGKRIADKLEKVILVSSKKFISL